MEVYFKKKNWLLDCLEGKVYSSKKITGPGVVFLEMDGHIEEYDLKPGEVIKVDTGHVAMFEQSVDFDIVTVKGGMKMYYLVEKDYF